MVKMTEENEGEIIKKEGLLTKLWNKTIFPEWIKRKKAEKNLRKEIQHEAKMNALKELKPQLVEAYKQKELDKMSGKSKGDFMQKLADGFKSSSNSENKISSMLGRAPTVNTNNVNTHGFTNPQSQIDKMLGRKVPVDRTHAARPTVKRRRVASAPVQQKIETAEEKIRRMLK